jgi:hypothetical protein
MRDDELTRRLRALGTEPVDPTLQAAHLSAIAAAGRRSPWATKLRVGAAAVAALVAGSTGLAAAGVLPDPAQRFAHDLLDEVGVDVPDGDRYHGPECGDEVEKNHGQYVRDDESLARTDCGKKVKDAGGDDTDGTDGTDGTNDGTTPPSSGEPGDRGVPDDECTGPPPWVTDPDMTAEEKADAQAERRARCGADGDEGSGDEAPGSAEPGKPSSTPGGPPSSTPSGPPTSTGGAPPDSTPSGNVPGPPDSLPGNPRG